MTQLTDATKISRVNHAFSELAQSYVNDGDAKTAMNILKSFETLTAESKAQLFDILTKN